MTMVQILQAIDDTWQRQAIEAKRHSDTVKYSK